MRVGVPLIVVGVIGSAVQARPEWPNRTSTHRTGGAPPVVTIIAHEYAFDGPDSIESGPTTFRLVSTGREQHFLGLVRITGLHTLSDYKRTLTWKVPPPWITPVGGVGTIPPGGTAATTLDLEPGLYVMMCDMEDAQGTAHWREGMLRSLIVLPRANGAVMPTPDANISLMEFAFLAPETLPAGFDLVEVQNAGAQPHMALVWRLQSNKSLGAVTHWLDTPSDTSHPVVLVGGVPDLAPGRRAQLQLSLAAGYYMMICLVDDPLDHRAHYEKGMIRELTVVAARKR